MSKKVDISSTAIEKGIDLAKDFLDKLILPPVEETGLLLKDQVTFWKFKNQVKILNKAKRYCEKHKISPKAISLKLLCPLLDYSALEEDEELQNNWAVLLSNMVDSEQNIENHVFPYILSQISSNEFALLENVYSDKKQRKEKYTEELNSFKKEKPDLIENLKNEANEISERIDSEKKNGTTRFDAKIWELEKKKHKLEREIKNLDYAENRFVYKINEPERVPEENLKEFEVSNLARLGLIKHVQTTFANSQTLEIPYETEREYHSGYLTVDLDVDLESEEEYILTELGELFVRACIEID